MAESAPDYGYRKGAGRMSAGKLNSVAMILVFAGVALWAGSKVLSRV